MSALEAKVESLKSMDFVQRPKSISQQSSQAKWQESSVKKIAPTKQTGGWAEVRMTKIEAKESTLRSSNIEAG